MRKLDPLQGCRERMRCHQMNDLPKIFGEEQVGSKDRWNGLPSSTRALALVLLFSIVFFAACAAIAAQTGASVSVPVRDPLAIQRLNLALTALGGSQNVSQMDSCIAEATRTSRNHSYSVKRFNVGNDYRYEVTLDGSTTVNTSRQTRKNNTTSASNMNMNGRTPSNRDPRRNIPLISPAMQVVPHLAPAALLRRMLDSATSLELIPADQSPAGAIGILMKKTSTITKQAEEQRWYFDSQTNLPVSVTYWLPSVTSLRNHAVLQTRFENFDALGGFTVPRQITTSIGSMTLGVENVTSLQCRQAISSDLFTSPEVQ